MRPLKCIFCLNFVADPLVSFTYAGENIAIITVRVQTARICNVHDQVTLWDVAQSAGTIATAMNMEPAVATGSGSAGSTAP